MESTTTAESIVLKQIFIEINSVDYWSLPIEGRKWALKDLGNDIAQVMAMLQVGDALSLGNEQAPGAPTGDGIIQTRAASLDTETGSGITLTTLRITLGVSWGENSKLPTP